MQTARCSRCGGRATADTFEEARKKINHSRALGHGIKCGDNYNMVKNISEKTEKPKKPKSTTPKSVTPKPEKKEIPQESSAPINKDEITK